MTLCSSQNHMPAQGPNEDVPNKDGSAAGIDGGSSLEVWEGVMGGRCLCSCFAFVYLQANAEWGKLWENPFSRPLSQRAHIVVFDFHFET